MPQFTESELPWSQLAAALQETTALKEHATVTGLATDTSAPQRIVLSPLRGPFKQWLIFACVAASGSGESAGAVAVPAKRAA